MEYSIYKLEFQTGVHFGTGMLNESAYTFCADQLFSALYIEALKMDCAKEFYEKVKSGALLFSDAFPYMGQTYMIPKPMIYVETKEQGISEQKKLYKKMKFISVDNLDGFLKGTFEITENPMRNYGDFFQKKSAKVRNEGETEPYQVGIYYYSEGCGLYLILAYKGEEEKWLAEDLLESLSYTGIGGKKTTGLGKFIFKSAKMPEMLHAYLESKSKKKILLSTALPKDEELESALENASYQLEKRSGFIASSTYAEEWRKKKDLYVFAAGSCFDNTFEGDIYDVSDGGKHSVYRYAKPLFLGVSI